MKNKKIGLDIDGCLNDLQDALITVLKRDYDINPPLDEYNITGYANIKDKDLIEFWRKYDPELHALMEVEKNAVEVILKLKSMGYTIEILTARYYSSAAVTINWLRNGLIHYDKIFFKCDDKLDVCKWRDIHIMIEDNPDNALLLAENNIKVLLFSRPYNLEISHPNIIRVNNWIEIYNQIKNL